MEAIKSIIKNLLLIAHLLLCTSAFAQVDFEFWFAAPEVTSGHGDRPIRLVLTSFGQPSQVTVSMPANNAFNPINVNIPANATNFIDLTPWIDLVESKPAAAVLNSGLLISSNNPIAAYYEVTPNNNPDIFTLKGQNALDLEFYIPQQNLYNNQPNRNPRAYAWFVIVASQDNTTINVDLTQDAFNHPVANNPHQIVLNRGQTYAFRPPNNVFNGPAKLGGSKVTSDKPIAITVSDDSNYGWTNLNGGGYDLIGDQIVGTSQIGKDYVVVRGPGLEEESIFVFATQDNTEIYLNDTSASAVPVATLNESGIYSFTNVTQGATFIHATNPVYVFHVSGYPKNAQNSDSEIGGALVPPLGCSGSSEIAFTRVNNPNFALILLVDSNGIGSFTATSGGNNIPILANDFDTVPGTSGQYYFYYREFNGGGNQFLTNAQTVITNDQSVFHCGMFNGDDPGLRYGYFSGFTTIQLGRDRPFCSGDTVFLDAGVLGEYNWFRKVNGNFNKIDSSRILAVVDSGTYVVTDNSILQCLQTDTVELSYHGITDAGLTPDTSICEKRSFTFTATAHPGFSYLWSTGDTTQTVTLVAPDTFRIDTISVILTDTNGCLNYDTTFTAFDTVINPQIFGADANGIFPAICIQDSIDTIFGTAPPNANYLAFFSGPGIIETDSTDDFALFDPKLATAGNHQILFTFIDTSTIGNCDVSDTVIIPVIPILTTIPDTQVCESANPFTITPDPAGGEWTMFSAAVDTTNFYNSNQITYTPLNGSVGPDTLVYFYSNGAGCFNTDTAIINLFASPPNDTLVLPAVCANTDDFDSLIVDLTQFADTFIKGITFFTLDYFSDRDYTENIATPTAFTAGNNDTVFVRINAGGGGTCPPAVASFIVFNVDSLPRFPNLADTSGFCNGDVLSLNAGSAGTYTYLWDNNSTNPIRNLNSGGVFWVQKTNTLTNCMSSDTLHITLHPIPFTPLVASIRLCSGDDTTLNAHAGAGANDFNFTWTDLNNNTVLSNTATLALLNQTTPGLYSIEKQNDSTKCFVIDTIAIAIDSLPVVLMPNDTAICRGDSIALMPMNDSTGYTYNWSGSITSNNRIIQADSGTYNLRIFNVFGCFDDGMVNVNYNNDPPNAICKNNNTVFLNNQGFFVIDSSFVDSGSNDICGILSMSLSRDSLFCADVGLQNITLTVFDVDSFSANCSTDILVVDSVAPQVICRNDTFELFLDANGLGILNPDSLNNGSSDNCNIAALTLSKDSFLCADLGINAVNLIATDVNGNVDSCEATIMVVDLIPPTVLTKLDTIYLDAAGFGSTTANRINNGSIDNCQIDSLWLSRTDFSCQDTGINLVTLYARDNSGNIDSALGGVLVIDSLAPQLVFCPSDTILYADSGTCQLFAAMPLPVYAENCFLDTILNNYNFQTLIADSFVVDTYTIRYFAVDIFGNLDSSCAYNITVLDTQKPQIICPSDTTQGLCNNTINYTNPQVFDNCAIDSFYLTSGLPSGSAFPIGLTEQIFEVVDVSGNTNTCSFTVRIDSLPFIDIGPDTTICDYDEILLSAGFPLNAGLDTFFTYLWSDNTTAVEYFARSLGPHWVTKTDTFGCSSSDTLILDYYISPVLNVGAFAFCEGDSLTFDVSDSTDLPGTNFLWSTGDTTAAFTTNTPGNFGIVKTDTNTCFKSDTLFVFENPLPQVDLGPDTAICSGLQYVVNLPPFEGITWMDSSNNNPYVIDSTGQYSVTVRDFNNCVGVDTLNVFFYPEPQISLGDSAIICSDSSVTLSLPPYFSSYTWSTGSTDSSITISTAGNYSVIILDTNNCIANDQFNLIVNTIPSINLGPDQTICNEDSALVSGPTGMAAYNWSNGANTQNVTLKSAATYTLTITDANGCRNIDTVSIFVDTLPIVNLKQDTSLCPTEVVVIDASGNFSNWTWSNGQNTTAITASLPGAYSVVVTDSNGCSNSSDTFNLTYFPQPNLSLGPNRAICSGDTLVIRPNQSFASYLWSNGSSLDSVVYAPPTTDITSDSSFSLGLFVLDSNGCSAADSIIITFNSLPQPNLGPDQRYCANLNFTTTITPGASFTNYIWSNGSIANSVIVTQNNTLPINLSVTVTDVRGCRNSDSISIAQDFLPVVNITTTGSLEYCDNEDYLIVADAGPGFNSYQWNTGSNGQILLIDTAGTYRVTVIDQNGCQASAQIRVNELQSPNPSLGGVFRYCEYDRINQTFNGPLGDTYLWNTGQTTRNITVNSGGVYRLTTTAVNGCTRTDSSVVIVENVPIIDFSEDTLLCIPSPGIPLDTQFVTLDATVEGYSYMWQDSSTNPVYLVNVPDTYTVNISNGVCEASYSTIIQQAYIPLIDLGPDTLLCEGQTLRLDATFRPSKVDYLWSDDSRDSILDVRRPGLYDVQINNSCGTFADNIFVDFEDCWNVWIPNTFTPNGDGDNDFFGAKSPQPFSKYELTIYNRHGDVLFFTNDVDRAWDGTSNGSPAPIGVYNYKLIYISAYDINQGEFVRHGKVTILR